MKFSDAFLNLASIFETAGLPVWPRDTVPTTKPDTYGVLDFVSSGSGVNYNSFSGQLIISINCPGGLGPAGAHAFADRLDEYLVKKSINGTQFFASALAPRGVSPTDPTKSRWDYTIPFKHFGAQ